MKQIIFVLLVLCLLVIPVNADNYYSGTLTSSGWFTVEYSNTGTTGGGGPSILARPIETTSGTVALIHFDEEGTHTGNTIGMKDYDSCSVQYKIGTRFIGNGTFGFQRNFVNNWPFGRTEIEGYQYFQMDEWNITGVTGNQTISVIGSCDVTSVPAESPTPTGANGLFFGAGSSVASGDIYWYRNLEMYNTYEAFLNTSTMLINGTVHKNNYYSLAFVQDKAGKGITTENTTSKNDFSFQGILSRPIYVGSINSIGQIFKSPLLNFTDLQPNVTYTPTPNVTIITPTTTPIPINGSIKVTVYDYVNNTPISGLSIGVRDSNDAGIGWFNVTAQNGVYTFSGVGAGGSTPLVAGHTYLFTFSKTGYVTDTRSNEYAGGNEDIGYYLMPLGCQPTASTFVLGIRLISTTAGDINVPLGGTVTLSNQSSTWTQSKTNPPAGIVMFSNLTAGQSYKIDANLNGYQAYTGYFASASSMVNTVQWHYAYLTPSDVIPSPFTLVINPSSGTINDTYSITLSGDISTATDISYKYYNPQTPYLSFNSVAGGQTTYRKVGASWFGWNGSSFSVATANPAQVSGKFAYATNPQESYMDVIAYITINGNVYQATKRITLVSIGKVPKIITAWDMSTSAMITNFDSHILDIYSNAWENTTYTQDTFSNAYYYATANSLIMYTGSATGYYDTVPVTTSFDGSSGTEGIKYKFYPIRTPPTVDNTTLHVNTKKLNNDAINNARVILNDNQVCYTNMQGTCLFQVLTGVTYTATASAYGYSSGTGSVLTSNTSANIINIIMVGATPTTTSITTPPTPRITPTYTNWTSQNATAFPEYTCTHDTGNLGLWQVFMNFIACAGVSGATNQGMIASGFIMLVLGMALSRYGKGVGALAGVTAGAAVSWGMGALPFWLLILVVTVCGLVFARLITGAEGGK